jgi:hypothetical protein
MRASTLAGSISVAGSRADFKGAGSRADFKGVGSRADFKVVGSKADFKVVGSKADSKVAGFKAAGGSTLGSHRSEAPTKLAREKAPDPRTASQRITLSTMA